MKILEKLGLKKDVDTFKVEITQQYFSNIEKDEKIDEKIPDKILRHSGWIYFTILVLNLIVCILFNELGDPSLAIVLVVFLIPLFLIQLCMAIVGYGMRYNKTLNIILMVVNILLLLASIYTAGFIN